MPLDSQIVWTGDKVQHLFILSYILVIFKFDFFNHWDNSSSHLAIFPSWYFYFQITIPKPVTPSRGMWACYQTFSWTSLIFELQGDMILKTSYKKSTYWGEINAFLFSNSPVKYFETLQSFCYKSDFTDFPLADPEYLRLQYWNLYLQRKRKP